MYSSSSAFNFSTKSHPTCQNLNYNGADSDIDMNQLYGVLDWSNIDGGAWKQGFEITTNDREWQGRKLKSKCPSAHGIIWFVRISLFHDK